MGPFHLLSGVTLAAAVGLAVVLLLVGLVLVPLQFRAGHRWRGWFTQAVVLLLLPTFVVLSVFFEVNRQNHLFTDWSDLLSPGGGGTTTSTQVGGGAKPVGAPTQAAAVPTAAATTAAVRPPQASPLADAALTGARDTADGQWITVSIHGDASGVEQTALVYLPPGYVQSPDQQYPVIFAFPGTPGAPDAFQSMFHMDQVTGQLVQNGTMRPSIVVALNVYPGADDTECVDAADGSGKYETWVAQDVVGWVRGHLRVMDAKSGGFATFGYSAGGWCASMFSVRHPDLFPVSISMAGYFKPWYDKGQPKRPVDDHEYDLARIVRETKPAVQMYFYCGGGDDYSLNAVKGMATAIKDSGGPTGLQQEVSPKGGHLISLWIDQTPNALTWLAQHDTAFAKA